MRRWLGRLGRAVLWSAGAAAVVLLAVVIAYAVDTRRPANGGRRVGRHVTLAGRSVSGLNGSPLAATVAGIAQRYETAMVSVDAPGGGFEATASQLGLRVDPGATISSARAATSGIGNWLRSLVMTTPAPVRVRIDPVALRTVTLERDPGPKAAPVEPNLTVDKGSLRATPGRTGRGIDPAVVSRALRRQAAAGPDHLLVRVGRGPVAPRFSIDDSRRLAAEATRKITRALAVDAGGGPVLIPPERLRTWLRTRPGPTSLDLAVDPESATAELATIIPNVGTPPVETTFTVEGGAPRLVPGKAGTGCCATAAATAIEGAVLAGAATMGGPPAAPVLLALRPVQPHLTPERATALGIKEVVGTFTTRHPTGQPRVSNIHRIADIVRGQVILPGESFSVNGFVGPRTTAKGFVTDHVIEEGRFTEAVGGGISQFATTTFNAAFFAGLEFDEYQAHSIYISRYPYGREATLSFPHPDLKVKNTTPFGVLIWPTYDAGSITITLYSTHNVDAVQSGQTTSAYGQCTRVRTERTRRYLDGTTKVDTVSALYQPAEGKLCPYGDSPTTTTKPQG